MSRVIPVGFVGNLVNKHRFRPRSHQNDGICMKSIETLIETLINVNIKQK